MSDKVIYKDFEPDREVHPDKPSRRVHSGGTPGPPGKRGPKGEGVLVLTAIEPIPANTPPNTVIFRRDPV